MDLFVSFLYYNIKRKLEKNMNNTNNSVVE